ncbi:MAG: hypothetical protein HXS43_12000 [Theionarchaea archaeon]|nr:hypothetical protein [Theionarchaea archaeon]
MTFDQLLNETVTVKRKSEIARGALNQPVTTLVTVAENVRCTMRRASARSQRDVWGENLKVDYEARMPNCIEIQEADLVEWNSLQLKVVAILEDTRHHHKRVALEVLQ